jgi:hypothetical protein
VSSIRAADSVLKMAPRGERHVTSINGWLPSQGLGSLFTVVKIYDYKSSSDAMKNYITEHVNEFQAAASGECLKEWVKTNSPPRSRHLPPAPRTKRGVRAVPGSALRKTMELLRGLRALCGKKKKSPQN